MGVYTPTLTLPGEMRSTTTAHLDPFPERLTRTDIDGRSASLQRMGFIANHDCAPGDTHYKPLPYLLTSANVAILPRRFERIFPPRPVRPISHFRSPIATWTPHVSFRPGAVLGTRLSRTRRVIGRHRPHTLPTTHPAVLHSPGPTDRAQRARRAHGDSQRRSWHRRWQFVVSGGNAASHSSPPVKVTVKGPAEILAVQLTHRERSSKPSRTNGRMEAIPNKLTFANRKSTTAAGLTLFDT